MAIDNETKAEKLAAQSDTFDLSKAYQRASARVLDGLNGYTAHDVTANFTRILNLVTVELDKLNGEVLREAVTEGRREASQGFRAVMDEMFNGRSFTRKDLDREGLSAQNIEAARRVSTEREVTLKNSAVYRNSYIELRGQLRGVAEALKSKVNDTMRDLAKSGDNTVIAATEKLKEEFKAEGVFNIEYKNGVKVGVNAYAAMVARSARAESGNEQGFNFAEEFETDLVECIGNDVTCRVCAQFRGRVFSISGKDKRFPPLREGSNAPLKDGYNIIHPNCRCQFVPYFEALHTQAENKAKQEFSDRPFEDDRTKNQAKAYQDWQAKNRQLWEEQREYEEMKRELGDKMPYTTLGGYRRAVRKDELPPNIKKFHYRNRDEQQYNRWMAILGKENMPASLADFQELKYNNNDGFIKLETRKENAYLDMDNETVLRKIGKLSNIKVRRWYIKKVESISHTIDGTIPLEEQAKTAFEARNKFRSEARNLMEDEETRAELDRENPNLTFEDQIEKTMKKYKINREAALKKIIESASRTNKRINNALSAGGEPDDKV